MSQFEPEAQVRVEQKIKLKGGVRMGLKLSSPRKVRTIKRSEQ